MKIILGKSNISSTVIADSINANGVRMTTLEIEYPRFILAELNTHRMLSKNSSSSRAIPVKRLLEQLETHYAEPVFWGKNQAGMQAKEELSDLDQLAALQEWLVARDNAMWSAAQMLDIGVHKQIANRVTEPWHIMKTVISGTEWNNLWWLRDHPDAQPEFKELAQCMKTSMDRSRPQLLLPGQWHLPYIRAERTANNTMQYWCADEAIDLYTAQQVSVACCAQVSYRRLDTSLEKTLEIYQRLIESEPKHMSPCEHQATPMPSYSSAESPPQWPLGITHQDRTGQRWSGNLKDWIQLRKQIPREAVW